MSRIIVKFGIILIPTRKNGKKIVFIHGKGEGVLRNAIGQELRKKYPRCLSQDASFQKYGFGATMVIIK